MPRYTRPPFQLDRPLFCKVPVEARGRVFQPGAVFRWREMKMTPKKIGIMYNQGYFYHSDELEEELEPTVGDGLEQQNLEALHKIVDKINEGLKTPIAEGNKVQTCRKSNIKDKQIGHIRSWRISYGKFEQG